MTTITTSGLCRWMLTGTGIAVAIVSLVAVNNSSNAQPDRSQPADFAPPADTKPNTPPGDFPEIGSGFSPTGKPTPEPTFRQPKSPFAAPPGAVKLAKEDPIWIDLKRKTLFIDGRVTLREGPPLEMFACPAHTKEHESIVAVDVKPFVAHAALMRLGAKVGHPVQFDPYQAATGAEIDIVVQWKDTDGRLHRAPAQHWIRHINTGKAMTHRWVFAGSGFWKDERTGKTGYKADSGHFICVSNFDTATLDLPIDSSQTNAELVFEAFTERIPPVGTRVRLILSPRATTNTDSDSPDSTSSE